MKKRLLCFLMIIFLLSGCAHSKTPEKRPDDVISKEIKEVVGDRYAYRGRHINYHDGMEKVGYEFEIKNFDATDIGEFVKACNDVCVSENKKISFGISFYNSVNSYSTLFSVSNYNDDGELYDGMYYLIIRDQTQFSEESCNPELYLKIEGIRELHVDKAIQKKADDMGIDWYSYWPDLEKVVVEEY